jgi:hypothetical protein
VKVGQLVSFTGFGEQPPGMGSIVEAHWDVEGTGDWRPVNEAIDGGSPTVSCQTTHDYASPGTYFASFRVGAHRHGAKGSGAAVPNLARVRVVVTG